MASVLITGASRGIGEALTNVFKSRGHLVIRHTRDEIGDLRESSTIEKLAALFQERELDVLINNAGVYFEESIPELTPSQIRETIEVNLLIPMILTRIVWPCLVARKGTVIMINSIAGRILAGKEMAYRASKLGLTGFSGALFYDGIRDGVRVIDIPLNGVNTDMLKHRPGMDKNPLQQPDEAAKLILEIFSSRFSSKIRHFLLSGMVIDNRCMKSLKGVINGGR